MRLMIITSSSALVTSEAGMDSSQNVESISFEVCGCVVCDAVRPSHRLDSEKKRMKKRKKRNEKNKNKEN